MNAEKILKLIAENRIDDLKTEAERELGTGKAESKSLYKARLEFSKWCKKEQKLRDGSFARPALAGAYIFEGKQCCLNSAVGAIYNNVYDGMETVPESVHKYDLVNMENLFSTYRRYPSAKYSVNMEELKKQYKIAKANKQKACIAANGIFFNVELFLRVAETLDCPSLEIVNNRVMPMIITGSNGRGLLCPLQVANPATVTVIDCLRKENER